MERFGSIVKKINALAGLAVIAALCCHGGSMCYSMLTGWYDFNIAKTFANIILIAVAVHAFLSITIFFFFHDGAVLKYKKENISTLLQRISAVAILILLHIHINTYSFMATGETLGVEQIIIHCTSEILYFASIMTHIAVSIGKGAVTLGMVKSSASLKRINLISYIICGIAMAAASISLLLFFIRGNV